MSLTWSYFRDAQYTQHLKVNVYVKMCNYVYIYTHICICTRELRIYQSFTHGRKCSLRPLASILTYGSTIFWMIFILYCNLLKKYYYETQLDINHWLALDQTLRWWPYMLCKFTCRRRNVAITLTSRYIHPPRISERLWILICNRFQGMDQQLAKLTQKLEKNRENISSRK